MITGGKSLVSCPPSFSYDGKKILVCTGNTVSVFSTSTGMQITELEGHTARVTSVTVLPANTKAASEVLCYCWTSSLDGTIRYWDFSVPEQIKIVDVRLPVFSMVIPKFLGPTTESRGKSPDLFAIMAVEDKNKQDDQDKAFRGKIWKYNLTKSSIVGGALAETRYPEFIKVSASGEFFGICNKCKIHVWKLNAKDSKYGVKKIKLHHTKKLTVLAFHPTERIIAAGDATGRILIWRDFGKKSFSEGKESTKGGLIKNKEERDGVRDNDDADSCSTWHWHPSAVKVLSFSTDGAYLYSGGKEGVLVVWQLETGKKKFLPRIGSPLSYFTDSPDPSLSSISCADNQIHLLQMPSLKVSKSIAGIKPASRPEIYEGLPSGAVFDQIAGLVAIPAESYCIQFYSLFDNREISQVQVCERNHQPDDDMRFVVTLLSLSMDGMKMSTVEVKLPEEGIGGLVCLKFWESESRRGEFKLSTIIYEPHSDASISALAFHPMRDMAVSASFGGDFKIWARSCSIQQKDGVAQKPGWRCNSVGSYKDTAMTAAAFSSDGSVLAIAAEAVITLWDPDNNVLIAVIGEMLMPIVSLNFVGKSEYVVSVSQGSKAQLSVWSTSKLSMSWSYKIYTEAVACNMEGSCFAVLALIPQSSKHVAHDRTAVQGRDGVILLFNVEDPIPLATWSVKKAEGGKISFIQADSSALDTKDSDGVRPPVMLAYVSGDHEYILFDPYSKEDITISGFRRDNAFVEETGKSGYASIYGELSQLRSERDQATPIPFVPLGRPWETIFSGPSHVIPPLTQLCTVFLESLLERRPVTVE